MPNLLRSRINANETAALSALRLISSSEIGFKVAKFRDDNKDGEGDYGTIEELDEHLATGTKHGYSFNVIVTPGGEAFPSAYSCRAIPLERGKTGVKSFYVDQTNVVRYSMDAAGPGPDSPILP